MLEIINILNIFGKYLCIGSFHDLNPGLHHAIQLSYLLRYVLQCHYANFIIGDIKVLLRERERIWAITLQIFDSILLSRFLNGGGYIADPAFTFLEKLDIIVGSPNNTSLLLYIYIKISRK